MLEAAIATLTEAQLAEYQKAAAYVGLVTICEPDDKESRLKQAGEFLQNAGITEINVPDIQAAIDGSTKAPKAIACALMDASEVGK